MDYIKKWALIMMLSSYAYGLPTTMITPTTLETEITQVNASQTNTPTNSSVLANESTFAKENILEKVDSEAGLKSKSVSTHESIPLPKGYLSVRRPTPRALLPSMEMLDKRRPKPKKPMGNDIGIARVLEPNFEEALTTSRTQNIPKKIFEVSENVSATLSKGEEESEEVSREMHAIMDAIPKMPQLHLPHLELQRDPEEEAINQRITEVARQLAESAMRREYEEEKLGYTLPIPTPSRTSNLTKSTIYKKILPVHTKKASKSAKSLALSNTLPLVSHLPSTAAQLQLLAEIQQIPQFMIREGFHPITPPPELSGPLLGGPPLDTEQASEARTGRAESRNLVHIRKNRGKPVSDNQIPVLFRISSDYMITDISKRGTGYFHYLDPTSGKWSKVITNIGENSS